MEFIVNNDVKDQRVKVIYKNYCKTFPESERRSEKQFKQLFKLDEVNVFSIVNENKCIGYAIIWKFIDLAFLEHFEVFEEFRNFKFGGKILEELKAFYPKIILETERSDTNENSNRRIQFYLTNSFHIISETYIQPSYGVGKPPLDLLLFANFEVEDVNVIVQHIHRMVYDQ